MKKLKSIGVLSAAKISGTVCACIALIFVPFILLAALLGMAVPGQTGTNTALGLVGALVVAVIFPIMYGVMGFILGALQAFVYNVVAKRVGGIELEIE